MITNLDLESRPPNEKYLTIETIEGIGVTLSIILGPADALAAPNVLIAGVCIW